MEKKFRLLTLLALLMTAATGAWAQEQWDVVWDFTAWSAETVTALKADAAASKLEGWSDVEKQTDAEAGADPTEAAKDNCFWFAGTVNEDGSLSANGAVIKELKGLKFNSDYAAKRSLAIAVNYPSTSLGDYAGGAYLWLGGSKQTCFTIPGVKAGSKITIEVESNKPSVGRGIGLYKNSYAAENLIGEQFTPTTFEAKTWEIAEDCNVVVYNTNSCHIYTIKVKAPADGTVYTKAVAISELKVGDILAQGASITGESSDVVNLDPNRSKVGNDVVGTEVGLNLTVSFGTNGTINNQYAPVTESGQDGDAWVVTNVKNQFGIYTVNLAGILMTGSTEPVAATYTVSMKDGVKDADKWTVKVGEGQAQALPIGGLKGDGSETVTLQYNGRLKVKGVKATSDAAPAAPATVDLDASTKAWADGSAFAVPAGGLTYSDAVTVSGNVTLTLTAGTTLTLNKGISLASGATLTIDGTGSMVVNGSNNSTASTVAGSTGTLVLTSGTLTAKGGNGASTPGGSDNNTGADGGVAINGAVTVAGGALTATGGNGGNAGEYADNNKGGAGAAAISGDVTMASGTIAATGGNGGNVGEYSDKNKGGAGGSAIAGNATLTGGTLTRTDGSNGSVGGHSSSYTVGAGGKAVAGTVTNNGGTVN